MEHGIPVHRRRYIMQKKNVEHVVKYKQKDTEFPQILEKGQESLGYHEAK
jgi:hypothetical protein